MNQESRKAGKQTRRFCCRYFHDDAWWALDVYAYDAADAQRRVAKLGNLQLLGELKATIPAVMPGAGWFARLVCTIGNALRRKELGNGE